MKLQDSFFLEKILKTFDKDLLKFRDTHKGESCYVFGNGPSLKWFDLKKFSDKPSISSGQLHYHKELRAI